MGKSAFGAMAIAMLATAALAKEGPVTNTPFAFNPASKTAISITGPIILSTNKIVFANGASADLKLIDPVRQGDWDPSSNSPISAQLFGFKATPGELLHGNSLCGQGLPASFMTVYRGKGMMGDSVLNVAIYSGNDEPTSAKSAQLCGTYAYNTNWASLPAGDGPYGSTSESTAAQTPADKGKWQVSVDKNPMDDSKTVVGILKADSGTSSFGQPVYLVARCKSNKTEVYVNWNDYLGNDTANLGDTRKSVTMRMGKDEPRRQTWAESTNSQATFTPMSGVSFLQKLAGKKTLVLQTTPYNSNPITAVFDTRGMRAALAELAETCNWKF